MLVKTLGAHFLATKKCSCCSALLIPLLPLLLLLLAHPLRVGGHVSSSSAASPGATADPHLVLVNKCCEKFEIHVDSECQFVNETGECPTAGL